MGSFSGVVESTWTWTWAGRGDEESVCVVLCMDTAVERGGDELRGVCNSRVSFADALQPGGCSTFGVRGECSSVVRGGEHEQVLCHCERPCCSAGSLVVWRDGCGGRDASCGLCACFSGDWPGPVERDGGVHCGV